MEEVPHDAVSRRRKSPHDAVPTRRKSPHDAVLTWRKSLWKNTLDGGSSHMEEVPSPHMMQSTDGESPT